MKPRLFVLIIVLVLALSLTGAVYADAPEPLEPNTIGLFTITPATVHPGDTVTFHFEFTVANADLSRPNVFCIYYAGSAFDNAPAGNTTSNLGDVYTADWDGVTDCPANGALHEWKLSVATPNADAQYGDFIDFSFTVPASAASDTFRLRQANANPPVTFFSGDNRALTVTAGGHPVDPTAITLRNLSAESGPSINWPLIASVFVVIVAMLIGGLILRKRIQQV